MYLTEFQLYNYKSFLDSGALALKPGFNLLTGQNNSGKTALLEGMSLRFQDRPHRSSATVPTPADSPTPASWARLRFFVDEAELDDFFRTTREFALPYPKGGAKTPAEAQRLFELIRQQSHLEIELRCGQQGIGHPSRAPSYGLYETDPTPVLVDLTLKSDGQPVPGALSANPSHPAELGMLLARQFAPRIYSFRAERLHVGRCPFGSRHELESNASNLPEVLNFLQGNPVRFERYNRLIRRVFPQIERITVRPAGERELEILVWAEDAASEREDLAVPLAESGSGLSQVLAMLYILVTSDAPRIILIDEPITFLHPGALRCLIEIFREHPQHQYILATHSAEVLGATQPSTLHVLRKQAATRVERVDVSELRRLQALLVEVGARLSDVFGADGVLWVEGKAEEQCFPLIGRRRVGRPLARVATVGILRAAGNDDQDSRGLSRLCDRVSQGPALLPPAYGFIFGRGLRTEAARRELEQQTRGATCFLPRRAYENYLLHPGALTALLNRLPPFTAVPTTEEKVNAWMDAHAGDARYYGDGDDRNYPRDVDAHAFLTELFSNLSYGRLDYSPVEHALALTEWLIENAPAALGEIADLLAVRLPVESM